MVTPEGAERWTAMELQMELSEGEPGAAMDPWTPDGRRAAGTHLLNSRSCSGVSIVLNRRELNYAPPPQRPVNGLNTQ